MIPNIVKGGDMRGLLRYLCSTAEPDRESDRGKRMNQHESPHVVGGDTFLQAWWDAEDLAEPDRGRTTGDGMRQRTPAEQIADYLDEPRKLYKTEIMAARWKQDANGERVPELDAAGNQKMLDTHVWHCSLSLADKEKLSEEEWQQVSREFMDKMEFTEASGKSPCRWVAIHHGPGKGGHEHVHIAASMVREDGTRWSSWLDFKHAQDACRKLEREYALTPVLGREFGTAMPGLNPAEKRLEEEHGDVRQDIAGRVRAAAVASSSEVEWIRRVREDGITLKPRFAPRTTEVVIGYRAGLNVATEGKAEWRFYGGGTLAKDLSLPRVRECWPAPTIEQAQAASDEWQRAYRGRPAGVPARAPGTPAPTAKDAITALQSYELRLRSVPAGDRIAWSHAARDVSGALSAWARVDPDHAGQLRQAAQVIARTAQDRRHGLLTRPMSPLAPALMFLAAEKPNTATKGALAAALVDLAGAFAAWHQTNVRLVEAQRLKAAGAQLEDTRERMRTGTPSAEAQQARAQRMRSAWGTPARGPRPASPLPNVLQPPTPTRNPHPSRGREIDGR